VLVKLQGFLLVLEFFGSVRICVSVCVSVSVSVSVRGVLKFCDSVRVFGSVRILLEC
jgi:hypothetical protein